MPYREQGNPNAGAEQAKMMALEKMKHEILKEGKTVAIDLSDNIEAGNPVPYFDEAISNKVKPVYGTPSRVTLLIR